MDAFMNFMEKHLVPIASKIGSQRHLVAIRDGFVAMIPVTMVGAFGTLIKNLPLPAYQSFVTNNPVGQQIATLGGDLWWGSLAMMGLFLVVSVAYFLAKSYDSNGLQAGLIALCGFLILSPQVANVANEAGEIVASGWGFIPWGYVSTNALFTAMVVAIVSTEIYVKLSKVSWLTIKMPDGVPPAVAGSFAKLLPGVIALFVIGIIGIFVKLLSNGQFLNDILSMYIAKPLTGIADSLWGTIIVVLLIHVLWIFGLHGANIVLPAVEPVLMDLGGKNAELAAHHATQGYHVFAGAFLDSFVYLGGSGMVLGLVIALFLAGKKRKEMIALGGPPAVFNISEPMIFGMPIVLNPIYMIPFVLAPVLSATVAYLAISSGIVPPVIMAKIPWITPPVISGIMATGSIKGGILGAVNLIISIVIYFPFVRLEDRMAKKKLAESQADMKVS